LTEPTVFFVVGIVLLILAAAVKSFGPLFYDKKGKQPQ
jgi:hypothetical protein